MEQDEFDARDDGLFRIAPNGSKVRICDGIRYVGSICRPDGGGMADVISFLTGGAWQELMVDRRAIVVDGKALFEQLADGGFLMPETKDGRDAIRHYVYRAREVSARKFLRAEAMGWHGNGFVIGQDIISPTGQPADVRLTGTIRSYAPKFQTSGTLAEYQEFVLRRAARSSRLMLAIGMALAAPLLRIVNQDGGGINLVGETGTGKTMALRVMGSFYKGPPFFETWSMTDNAPETLGYAHSDLPLSLDELDALDGNHANGAGRLKVILHRLTSGVSKAHSHRAIASAPMLGAFRTLFLSSSEESLPTYMSEGGSKASGGQAARFVDVPADAGHGLKIFERLSKSGRSGASKDPDELMGRLLEAIERHYGTIGREFLQYLVDDNASQPDQLRKRISDDMRFFKQEAASDPVVPSRIRERFALIYAAGKLGSHYGIIPAKWNWLKAVGPCYADAVASSSGAPGAHPAEVLRAFLDRNAGRIMKFEDAKASKELMRSAVAFKRTSGSKRELLIPTAIFNTSIFPGAEQAALRVLRSMNVLIPDSSGKSARQQRFANRAKMYVYHLDRTALAKAAGRPETS